MSSLLASLKRINAFYLNGINGISKWTSVTYAIHKILLFGEKMSVRGFIKSNLHKTTNFLKAPAHAVTAITIAYFFEVKMRFHILSIS